MSLPGKYLRTLSAGVILLLGGFAGGMFAARQLNPAASHSLAPRTPARMHTATFVPLAPPRAGGAARLPTVDVIDVARVRSLAGRRSRLRGKIYRVGHSAKSNTYFLDFGPLPSSFTAVIFASAADSFERAKIEPRSYEGKEVEIVGTIEDDPRYGLEMIIEDPAQIQIKEGS